MDAVVGIFLGAVALTSVPYYYFLKFSTPYNLLAAISYCYFQMKFLAVGKVEA